ncbi:MAG: hypothetical protein ACTH3B_04350, partial [Pseudoalteromonas sp.]
LRLDTKILKLWPKLVDHYIANVKMVEIGKKDAGIIQVIKRLDLKDIYNLEKRKHTKLAGVL